MTVTDTTDAADTTDIANTDDTPVTSSQERRDEVREQRHDPGYE